MEVATLVIATTGVALASFSLVWQVSAHVLTGGRVRIWLLPRIDVIAVQVRATGRMPVTVESMSLVIGLQSPRSWRSWRSWRSYLDAIGTVVRLGENLNGPSLPHTLPVGTSATWTTPAR